MGNIPPISEWCHNPPAINNITGSLYLSNLQNIRITSTTTRQSNLNDIRRTSSHINSQAFVLGCKKQQNLKYLNKYMLMFNFYINDRQPDIGNQIDDFIRLLKSIDFDNKNRQEIQRFLRNYKQKQNLAKQRSNFVINQIFKNNLFSSVFERFPTISEQPKCFGYIKRPFVDLFKGIKSKYRNQQKKKKQIYCVVQIKKSQQDVLNKIVNQRNDNYLAFSTFLRCFSNQDKARKRLKQLRNLGKQFQSKQKIKNSTLFFTIFVSYQNIDEDYDYGFYQDTNQVNNQYGDIILNTMNYFKISSGREQKQYQLNYNALAKLIHEQRQRILTIQPDLLKINSIIQGKSQQLKSISYLIRATGRKQDSIDISITQLNNSNILRSKTNILRTDLQQNQRINLIQTYIEKRQYEKALLECDCEGLHYKVRKAQVYYEWQKNLEVDQLLNSIQSQKKSLKSEHFQQYVLYEFLSAKRMTQSEINTQALKRIKQLRVQMLKNIHYRHNYEFRARQIEKFFKELQGGRNESIQWDNYTEGLNNRIMLSR